MLLVVFGWGCCPPPVESLPEGSFLPEAIPPSLVATDMAVTIEGDQVSFNYTAASGERVVVTYIASQ